MSDEVFHEGERALQERVGNRPRMAQIGAQLLRAWMPDQHREFFRNLPFVVVGGLDARGQPWATTLAAPAGFIESPSPQHLRIHAIPDATSPLAEALRPGMPLGLLGIEPHTRRRNRVNGVVTAVTSTGFEVEVRQSFGNCPKYIQARRPTFIPGHRAGAVSQCKALTPAMAALIRRADTLFIASAHPRAAADEDRAHGVDVSHRGGKPGFVRVDDDATLTLPDFAGNGFFNTLGNLLVHSRAGLLIPDFDTGDLLLLAVEAAIVWEGQEVAAFAGAQRLLRLRIHEARMMEAALPLRWSAADLSPQLLATGAW